MHLIRVELLLGFLMASGVAVQDSSSGTGSATVVNVPRVRVAGGVVAGNIIKKVAPRYPEDAKEKHISGTVTMHAVIGKDGRIGNLTVISGPAELQKSALTAVKQWTYRPYLLNGQPTEVDTTITVNYNFAGGPMPLLPEDQKNGQDEPEPEAVLKPFDLKTVEAPPGYIQVSANVMAGLLEHKVDPVYPETDATGYVVLIAAIGRDGEVKQVQVVSGPAPLRPAALSAVQLWRYRPYVLNGEPTAVQTSVAVRFAR